MADLNVWAVTGRLTKDAEFRTLATGKALLTCEIAINTGWGDYAKTTYARVQQWGERGKNIVKYLKKGKPIAVSGTLTVNTWTRKDGIEVQQLQLDTSSIQLLSGGGGEAQGSSTEDEKVESLEDVPF